MQHANTLLVLLGLIGSSRSTMGWSKQLKRVVSKWEVAVCCGSGVVWNRPTMGQPIFVSFLFYMQRNDLKRTMQKVRNIGWIRQIGSTLHGARVGLCPHLPLSGTCTDLTVPRARNDQRVTSEKRACACAMVRQSAHCWHLLEIN